MTQALYAHMNNKTIKKKEKEMSQGRRKNSHATICLTSCLQSLYLLLGLFSQKLNRFEQVARTFCLI
jgi:cell division protein FtsB